jgi:hypothetical protein
MAVFGVLILFTSGFASLPAPGKYTLKPFLFLNLVFFRYLQNGPLQVASERAWLLLCP